MVNIDKYRTNGKWTYKGFLQFMEDNWADTWGINPILDLMKRNPDIRCYFFEEYFKKGLDDGYFITPFLLYDYKEEMFNKDVYLTINNVTVNLGKNWYTEITHDIEPNYHFNSLYGCNQEIFDKLRNEEFKLTSFREEAKKQSDSIWEEFK